MAENNTVGILAYGAYLPRLRLARKAVADANAWFNPALKGLAKGERTMCNWDEDAVTMAVEAARELDPRLPMVTHRVDHRAVHVEDQRLDHGSGSTALRVTRAANGRGHFLAMSL